MAHLPEWPHGGTDCRDNGCGEFELSRLYTTLLEVVEPSASHTRVLLLTIEVDP